MKKSKKQYELWQPLACRCGEIGHDNQWLTQPGSKFKGHPHSDSPRGIRMNDMTSANLHQACFHTHPFRQALMD